MNRRSFLGAAAATMVAGPKAAGAVIEGPKASMAFAGNAVLGGRPANTPCASVGGSGQVAFTSFKDWLTKGGEDAIRHDAKYVDRLDPDLAEMRLPLVTKFRMQQKRNYERIKRDRKRDILRRLAEGHGKGTWWF
ncbi:MAG: hypothetical protein RIA64_01395 [Rhodospirillales bacterium]